MDSKVMEIARDVYRISTFKPDFGIQFNQFLNQRQKSFEFRVSSFEFV